MDLKVTPLDRSIADRLRINANLGAKTMNQFSQLCDAVLMSELTQMTPEQRLRHADWYSTGPVDSTVTL